MMVGYVDIAEQVDADFTRALRRAFAHRVGARLRGAPSSHAASFEDAARTSGARNKMRLGRRIVAIERIVGSVGRTRDFDWDFLPIRRSMRERWERVDRAFHLGVDLAPVVLYELGGRYFVLDGNHRVSVARYQGVQWIEAEVTRFYVGAPTTVTNLTGTHQTAEEQEEIVGPVAA